MVMGTAATMMAITEALGLALPGASSIPAADANHPRMCGVAGRRIVEMVWEDLTPDKILTPAAFDNAIKVHMAMGGSTNAIIHVVAMARRAGIPVDMEKFDQLSRQIPVLANVRPSGKYLMEDFFYAGGLRAMMQNLREKLDLSCMTVTGKTIGENIEGAKVHIPDVIHSLNDPIYAEGATAVLKGNLAPNGCVIKPAAADPRFLKHRGKAIAFEDYNHMMREIERDDLDVTPDHILVLKNAGPKGGPGMPEWGMLPIPKRLLGQGVRDMIRISDGRMSGTSYGACILHVAPESFVGGPLNFVQTGDEIEIDVDKRSHPSARQRRGDWPAARPPGSSRRRNIRAATARCSPSTSARPTRAAISISSRARRRCPSRRFIESNRLSELTELATASLSSGCPRGCLEISVALRASLRAGAMHAARVLAICAMFGR